MRLNNTTIAVSDFASLLRLEATARTIYEFAIQRTDGYSNRKGAVVIGVQATHYKQECAGDSMLNLTYGQYKHVMTLQSEFISNEIPTWASRAIVSLTQGTGLFEGQANRHLDPGIYYPDSRNPDGASTSRNSLMSLEANYGRILVGYADNSGNAGLPPYVGIHLAIAKTMVMIFPADHMLKKSYDQLLKTNHGLSPTETIEIEAIIETIFEKSPAEQIDNYRRHLKKNPADRNRLPFCYRR